MAGTLGQGGAERQLFYQVQTLKHCGARPSVICFSNGEYWQAKIEALGIPVFTLTQARTRPGRLFQMMPILHRLSPKLIQSAHFYTNLYAVFAARSLGIREIGAVRNDGIQDLAETGVFGGSLNLKAPRCLAINSKNAIQNIVNMGLDPAKLFYLPNVVDTEKFSPYDFSVRDKIHLIMVGRLVVQKRFDTFLRVLSALLAQNSTKVIGHIIGDGVNREKLQVLACQLGLGTEQVCFHGAVPDVEHYYRQADVCMHLSDWEGLPNTILEAMACGLPVIASRVGGIPELVQEGQTGSLIEPGNADLLLTRVSQLVSDEDVRKNLGRSARAFIEQNHALYSLPGILENFYEAILA